MSWPTVSVGDQTYRAPHRRDCRGLADGAPCWERSGPVYRQRTELAIPVPSVIDAIGQHITARVLKRAGYSTRPPYRPEDPS